MVQVSCHGCEISGRLGFAYQSSDNYKALSVVVQNQVWFMQLRNIVVVDECQNGSIHGATPKALAD